MTANNSRLVFALMLSTALSPWLLVQAAESDSNSPASAPLPSEAKEQKSKNSRNRATKPDEKNDIKAGKKSDESLSPKAESKPEPKTTTADSTASDKSVTGASTTGGATTTNPTAAGSSSSPATTSPTAPSTVSPTASSTATSPAPTATPPASPETPAAPPATSTVPKLKTKWKPGDELTITTNTEDLIPTDDAELARKQVTAYPDSPEASFILAVALTRTSKVEDALKEVRRARKLAEAKGGTGYFDKMITTYEDMLKNFPEENRVRYGLAWAYYMKAYLLANYSKKVAAWKAANGDPNNPKPATTDSTAQSNTAATATDKPAPVATKPAPPLIPGVNLNKSGGLDLGQLVNGLTAAAQGGNVAAIKIPSIMDKTDPADVPQIKRYYELALKKLDDLLARKPDDVWAQVYRAHLKAEYTGGLDEAMKTWTQCKEKFPNNPASYFFLGEGYLKQGNLKESINNVSRAVALRSMGF